MLSQCIGQRCAVVAAGGTSWTRCSGHTASISEGLRGQLHAGEHCLASTAHWVETPGYIPVPTDSPSHSSWGSQWAGGESIISSVENRPYLSS